MLINYLILGILGTQEIIVILIVVLILFGGKKIPELMRGIGKGIKEFKDAANGISGDEDKKKPEEDPSKKS